MIPWKIYGIIRECYYEFFINARKYLNICINEVNKWNKALDTDVNGNMRC